MLYLPLLRRTITRNVGLNRGVGLLRPFLHWLNSLFDPRKPYSFFQLFTLRNAGEGEAAEADITVHTNAAVPDLTQPEKLRLKAAAAERTIDRTLGELKGDITGDLELDAERLRDVLNYDETFGVVFRKLSLPGTPARGAYVVYVDGLVDSPSIEKSVIEPLMFQARFSGDLAAGLTLQRQIEETLMTGRRAESVFALSAAVEGILSGKCALLVETVPGITLIDARKWPARAVERSKNEGSIRGSQEGFTEVLLTNTALLRRRLFSPDLVFEPGQIGRRSRTNIALVFLKDLANPKLVTEARRRLANIDIDVLLDSGQLEQMIEDVAAGLFPTMHVTERPDRVVAALSEGRLAILVDGSPNALIAPSVFGDMLRFPEDYYVKWPFGTLLRLVRILGMMITLLLPALYIAIADFHHEMIPPALLTAIAASREQVPFPAFMEVLIMEIAFEVIREGALRVPSVLGQTIGIVGALILGQAAVEANIVSPILVIIVATTALGSFTIPDYSMNLVIRAARFAMIFLGASLGLFGVAIGLFVISVHAASLKSFGVPYLAPSGPPQRGNVADNMLRGPLFTMDRRPAIARPRETRRQTKKLMDWKNASSTDEGGE